MLSGYVPEDFRCGMLIPIANESGAKRAFTIDQFRGITISPVCQLCGLGLECPGFGLEGPGLGEAEAVTMMFSY